MQASREKRERPPRAERKEAKPKEPKGGPGGRQRGGRKGAPKGGVGEKGAPMGGVDCAKGWGGGAGGPKSGPRGAPVGCTRPLQPASLPPLPPLAPLPRKGQARHVKQQLLTQYHSSRGLHAALIRRKVRLGGPGAGARPAGGVLVQLRVPPAPLPLSWGRTVRPYAPPPAREAPAGEVGVVPAVRLSLYCTAHCTVLTPYCTARDAWRNWPCLHRLHRQGTVGWRRTLCPVPCPAPPPLSLQSPARAAAVGRQPRCCSRCRTSQPSPGR